MINKYLVLMEVQGLDLIDCFFDYYKMCYFELKQQ